MNLLSRLFGREKPAKELHSLVFLLTQPRSLEEPKLREAIGSFLMKVQRSNTPPEITLTKLPKSGTGLLIAGEPFAILSVPESYTDKDPKVVTADLRKQRLLEKHRAWLACDWLVPIRNAEDHALAYRVMGTIMAILALDGSDIVGVLNRASDKLVPWDSTMQERLISEFPESIFEENVAIISDDGLKDDLERATAEAKLRLPEFVMAFENRNADAARGEDLKFAVKARFTEGDEAEWMWVNLEFIEGDNFEGRLGNDPDTLKRLKLGDRVTVKFDEVVDWIVAGDGDIRGGFSVKVFKKKAKR